MRWLITGGCGFIGVNLVKRILSEDSNVSIKIVDNFKTGQLEDIRQVCDLENDDVFVYPEDIKDAEFAMRVCKDVDTIVHLAANTGVPVSVEYPVEDCYNNIIGTLNYLEAARHNGVKRFIFASSSAVPGDYEPPFHEKLFPRPISPYGASKGAGEAYCHVYNETYGVETVALRFSNVYGPYSFRKESQLISKFIMSAMQGETMPIYGDGSQTRDFCFVDDLMDVLMECATRPNIGGNVFQVATNVETSVQQITDTIIERFRQEGVHDLEVEYVDKRAGDVARNYSDVSKAKKLLGWSNNVGIEEGINKTIDWYLINKGEMLKWS